MKNIKIDYLKIDIENAEKFFIRKGKEVIEAYKVLDENIDKVNNFGVKKCFIYIPESHKDMFDLFLN